MMTGELNAEFILSLYDKYAAGLKRVRNYEKRLCFCHNCCFWFKRVIRFIFSITGFKVKDLPHFSIGLDDIEAEIVYLLIREAVPETIVEISPRAGWSTTWILNALKDNGSGKLYSYDLVDVSIKMIPSALSMGRWVFVKGDIKNSIDKLPAKIDFLLMDSDHSGNFTHWYIQNIFPKLKSGALVSVHDVFHADNPSSFDQEGGMIINWLRKGEIKYFTASYAKEKNIYERISLKRKSLKLSGRLSFSYMNPMIFFIFKN